VSVLQELHVCKSDYLICPSMIYIGLGMLECLMHICG